MCGWDKSCYEEIFTWSFFSDIQPFYCSDELPRSQCIVRLKAILQEKGLTCTVCAPFRAQTCHHRRHMVSQRTLTFPVYRCHPPTPSQDSRFKIALVIAFGSCLDQLCHLWSSCMEQSAFLQFCNFYARLTSDFMLGQDLMRFHHNHNLQRRRYFL